MKKKIFITGASGTVGKAFIKEYYNLPLENSQEKINSIINN